MNFFAFALIKERSSSESCVANFGRGIDVSETIGSWFEDDVVTNRSAGSNVTSKSDGLGWLKIFSIELFNEYIFFFVIARLALILAQIPRILL